MRMIIFAMTILILIMPHAAYSQQNGEAQTVIVENDKRLTLKFSNKADKQRCGLFVSNRLLNQEQAFAIRVSHFHYSSRQVGGSMFRSSAGLIYSNMDGYTLLRHESFSLLNKEINRIRLTSHEQN